MYCLCAASFPYYDKIRFVNVVKLDDMYKSMLAGMGIGLLIGANAFIAKDAAVI